MMLITRLIKSRENIFGCCMNIFMVHLACCQLALFLTVFKIFEKDIATDFRREIYVKNQKTNQIEVFRDDGSF